MYGTVARMRAKSGAVEKLAEILRGYEGLGVPGYRGSYAYQMDDDPNTLYLAVIFESKEAYHANAESPEQDARYREMLALLEGPPEWHDGEIVSS
jgi:quinol monooxygenase YgiN